MKKIKISNKKSLEEFINNLKKDTESDIANIKNITVFENSKLEIKPYLSVAESISYIDTIVNSVFLKKENEENNIVIVYLHLLDIIKFKVMLDFYTNIEINDLELVSELYYNYISDLYYNNNPIEYTIKQKINIRQYEDLDMRLFDIISYQKEIYLKEYMSPSDMIVKSISDLIEKCKDIGSVVIDVLENIGETFTEENQNKLNETLTTMSGLIQLVKDNDNNSQKVIAKLQQAQESSTDNTDTNNDNNDKILGEI